MNMTKKLDLEDCLDKVNSEFDSLETFIENNEAKGDRFKSYLKNFYDFLKVNDDVLTESVTNNNSSTKSELLPELIVDKSLVDNEQIYQQLQLYNNDTSSSLASLTKFFSKCLVSLDSLSFNVKVKKTTNGDALNSNGTTTDNVDSNDGEDEQDELDLDGDSDEDSVLSDDSIENMLKNSKMKAEIKNKEKSLANGKNKAKAQKETEFGIPDGSDSEISDFDVDENNEADLDDDEEGEEEEEKGEEELEDDEEEDFDNEEKDDIDSDEVDEDLVDLYTDLGDEKEVMGIGKSQKSFNQVDFDREDFGLGDEDAENDDQEYDNEPDEEEKSQLNKQQKQSKVKDLFAGDESDDENNEEKKSSFEIRQSKLKEQVEDIHKTMLNELTDKPWQLQGESTARSRPKESLLEEYLDFDHTTRQAPITSAKTTEELEAIIKQRIKDKAFDDVERKVKPIDMQYEYKKQVVLDQEKSKLGLSEVYEQEFLKQQNGTDEKSKDQVNPKHEEIRKQMQNLFMKLDALSNFHYTPKAPAPEIKVISNMPSIAMEEVAPVSVVDSNILAPEEVKKNIKALPKSKSEEDKKDKKKNLRAKKVLGKKKKAKKEEMLRVKQALNPDDPKLAKEAAMNKLIKQSKNKSKNVKILKQDKKEKINSAYRSSHAFFQQLQETNNLGSKLASKKRLNDSSTDKTKLTSKKLKL